MVGHTDKVLFKWLATTNRLGIQSLIHEIQLLFKGWVRGLLAARI